MQVRPFRRKHVITIMLVSGVLLSAGLLGAGKPEGPASRDIALSVAHVPLKQGDARAQRLGLLEWRGGIQMRSDDPDFGGLSGLSIGRDGRSMLAVSDQGYWFSAELAYDDRGNLAGLGKGHLAPMLDETGKPLDHKAVQDAEGLAVLAGPPGGLAFVSYEREHRIWSYDMGAVGFAAKAQRVAAEPELGELESNSGLESIVIMPGSTPGDVRLLALSEASHDRAGNIRAFILKEGEIEHLAVREHTPYSPTDAGFLPNGDLLVLERRFSPVGGVGMAIRRMSAETIKAGTLLDGPVIAEAGGQSFSVDNMEGMSIRQTEEGRTFIYLISDDNFNHRLQRTLLLMFELKQ